MNELIGGKSASTVFRDLLRVNPQLTSRDLAHLVASQYPDVDGAAIQLIRRWVGAGTQGGVSDLDLDMGVAHFLKTAGYLK